MAKKISKIKEYYYIDIDLSSRAIVGWGIAERGDIEVHLSEGFHRLFVSKGQYNKLTQKLSAN